MATADELLAYDTSFCTVDENLRTITIPSSEKVIGVESDEDVNRLWFSLPRVYDGVDLSTFDIRINYTNANGDGSIYVVDDAEVGDDTITFSWLVSRLACEAKGNVKFVVCLKETDDDGTVTREYNTTVHTLTVLEGLETTEAVVSANDDVIELILSTYATTDYVDEAVLNATMGDVDLSGYATTSYVDSAITNVSIADVDLSDYLTQSDAAATYQPIGDYVTNSTLTNTLSGYPTFTQAMVLLDGYVTSSMLTSVLVPDYVQEEAERVARAIMDAQTDRCVTILAQADAHQDDTDSSITTGNMHAGMAANIIASRVQLDLLAMLGDFTWGSSTTTIDTGVEEIAEVCEWFSDAASKAPTVRLVGNHDHLVQAESQNGEVLSSTVLGSMVGASNPWDVWGGSRYRGYGYFDLDAVKVRVIGLNTSDADDGEDGFGSGQMEFFASSLDMTDKDDESEWQVLVLSHFPLDWAGVTTATSIISAFVNRSSVTVDGTTHSYASCSATFIANIHGHTHCYLVDNLNTVSNSTGTPIDGAIRIATPNSCCSRNNEYGSNDSTEYYGIEFGEDTTYAKSVGTAEDTAMCAYVIDLDARSIECIHYGAGYDRTVSYLTESEDGDDTGTASYTNAILTSLGSDGEIYNDGAGYKDGVYASSNGVVVDSTDSGYWSTGFIVYDVPESGLPETIYVKGWTWDSTSHCRMYFASAYDGTLSLYITGVGTGNNSIETFFTIECLDADTNYYSLTPIASDSGYSSILVATAAALNNDGSGFRLSMPGSGEGVIVSIGNPIED